MEALFASPPDRSPAHPWTLTLQESTGQHCSKKSQRGYSNARGDENTFGPQFHKVHGIVDAQ